MKEKRERKRVSERGARMTNLKRRRNEESRRLQVQKVLMRGGLAILVVILVVTVFKLTVRPANDEHIEKTTAEKISVQVRTPILEKGDSINSNAVNTTIVHHTWTSNELRSFWDTELQKLIGEQLITGTLPYAEVNERFNTLNAGIMAKTGKVLNVSPSITNHWASKEIEGSLGTLTNGGSSLELYLPIIADTFERLRGSNLAKWHEAFQSHMITIFMHEMEHTASSVVATHVDATEESRAWADTCRYTLVPIVEKYHIPTFGSDHVMYLAWRDAGADPQSATWRNAIMKRYGSFDGLTNTNLRK